MDLFPLLYLSLDQLQVVVKALDLGCVEVSLVHSLILRSDLLVALVQSHANVLDIVDHTLAEVVVFLVMQLQIREQVSLADHVVAVHVKHLEGKLLELF